LIAGVAAHAGEYRDTEYGFVISPPKFAGPVSGSRADSRSVMVFVAAAGPPEQGLAPNVNVMIQKMQTTREGYLQLTKSEIVSAGLKLRSETNRMVSGKPAVVLEYEGTMGGRELRFLQLAVVLPDRVILATYTAAAADFPTKVAEFRKSLETFQLTN
jgi:hypothetical protein